VPTRLGVVDVLLDEVQNQKIKRKRKKQTRHLALGTVELDTFLSWRIGQAHRKHGLVVAEHAGAAPKVGGFVLFQLHHATIY